MTLKVYITKGLPASGKTTWALEQVAKNPNGIKRINKDDLRAMLDGGHYSKGNEKFVLRLRNHLIGHSLLEGKHVIVDDTNLNPIHEAEIRDYLYHMWKDGLLKEKPEVHIIEFPTSIDECIQRDLARPNSVGPKVIIGQAKQWGWQQPVFDAFEIEPYVERPGLPWCIIVDLDGTLALHNGRDPYDGSRCMEDLPNEPIIELLDRIIDHDSHLPYMFVFSGRNGKWQDLTREWLNLYVPFGYMHLRMRDEDDMRDDRIVKYEMFNECVRDRYNVLWAIDDRNKMVEFWRALGLTCLQVADGDF